MRAHKSEKDAEDRALKTAERSGKKNEESQASKCILRVVGGQSGRARLLCEEGWITIIFIIVSDNEGRL